MVRNIWSLCKPGARVCGMGSSPKCPADKLARDAKYGRIYTIDEETYYKKNGSKYVVRIVDDEANLDISLVLYWYSAEHYERVFKEMGFVDFRWVTMEQNGDEENADYWKEFLTDCTLIMYEAFKPLQDN